MPANYRTTGDGMTTDGDGGAVNKETVKPPLDQLVVNLLDLVFENLLLGEFTKGGLPPLVKLKVLW